MRSSRPFRLVLMLETGVGNILGGVTDTLGKVGGPSVNPPLWRHWLTVKYRLQEE